MTFKKRHSESLQDRQIRRLAGRIPSAVELDRILNQAQPLLRRAVFERLRPLLTFAVEAEDLPCLARGAKKASDA
jgi:hypothetical protein